MINHLQDIKMFDIFKSTKFINQTNQSITYNSSFLVNVMNVSKYYRYINFDNVF